MAGSARGRQDLPDSVLPQEAHEVPLPAWGGERNIRELFKPLGWADETTLVAGPDGGRSR